MNKTHKRKTRAQRKALIVAIISSVLTVGFIVGSIVSGLHLPKRDDLESLYESNFLESVVKGPDDSSFVIASHKDENNSVDNAYIYQYDSDNKLLQKHSLFEEANEKFGISDLISVDGLVTSYESDSLYVFSQKHLFKYKGLTGENLELVSHTDQFKGKVVNVASDGEDVFVVSQDAKQYRIDRFKDNDNSYNAINSGYIYDISNASNTSYKMVCSRVIRIYSFKVRGDYLYIYTSNYIRRINKNLSGINFRITYENEYKSISEAHPELTQDEINTQIITKYGWNKYNYETHELEIPHSKISKEQFAFYINPDAMAGILNYKDNLYFVDRQRAFYKYSVDELDENTYDVINSLEDFLEYDEDFVFDYVLTSLPDQNAFGYDEVGTTAMIYYEESTPMMSVFDLEKEQLILTVKVSTRVEHSFYNETKDTIVYKYSDPVNRQSGYSYLASFVVKDEINSKSTKVALTIFIVLSVVLFISSLISWLCYLFNPVMKKNIEIAKGVRKHWVIYAILFPSILILCLFCYYPGIAAIFTSFYDYKAGVSEIKTWNNFANYVAIFGNKQSLAHFGNMVLFLLADVVLAIIPPLIFAFFLTLMRHKKLSGIIRTLLFIPGIIPGIAGLLIWRTGIYGDYGLVNSIIKASGGTPILFFRQGDYLNMIWLIAMGFPFVGSYLIFYGAMMNIPSSYYEAAELDGITVFKRFIKIDIPLCLPQMKYVLIMTIIASIQNFSRVYIAMGGMPGVVSTPIVEMYMLMNASERNYGLASAYATVLFVILFFMTYLSMRRKMKES